MDSDLFPGQNVGGLLCVRIATLSTLTVVTFILLFTCRQAFKVKTRRKIPSYSKHETAAHDEELDSEVKFQLDNKYTNIPQEYINQTMDFLQDRSRSSSGISSMTSSQYRIRRDSQVAVDPKHCEERRL